jgi:SAM-dependent methyltransferase
MSSPHAEPDPPRPGPARAAPHRPALPAADRPAADVAGHWLLARLGKRVLRPGGAALTAALLDRADLGGTDVVELAPGLGRTARDILDRHPRSYVGVDADPAAAAAVARSIGGSGQTVVADAAATALPDACADVVIGEAMLTMQGDRGKDAVIAEAARLLRPGGRYAIHELALGPDTVPDAVGTEVRQGLARAIRVNARPLPVAGWRTLLEAHGLVVDHVDTAPMALLEPRRIIADEGLLGALRFARNLLTNPDARRRVLAMGRTFRSHRAHLVAVAITAHRPAS